jgi:hypothetical protein
MHVSFGVTFSGLWTQQLFISIPCPNGLAPSSPREALLVPLLDHHKFQIFAAVACNILWFYRNKAFHEGASFNAILVSNHINKISLEHLQAWHSSSTDLDETWLPPPIN